MLSFILALIIILIPIVLPAMRKNKIGRSAKKSVSSGTRNPRDYGNITLDNKIISQRGKGVLDPSAMYSDSKRAKEQAKK